MHNGNLSLVSPSRPGVTGSVRRKSSY